jgi:hypothetical protein
MSRVSATVELPGRVYDAEQCWYDLDRWPKWVDQFHALLESTGDWPKAGSTLIWQSTPAGRGRVTEDVVEYEPRSGQTSQVDDDSITGRQSVRFTALEDGVELQLSLEYRLKRRSPFSAVTDLLFIRRLMAASLARTLAEFQLVLGDSPAGPFE